jgi:hypothetical protein
VAALRTQLVMDACLRAARSGRVLALDRSRSDYE